MTERDPNSQELANSDDDSIETTDMEESSPMSDPEEVEAETETGVGGGGVHVDAPPGHGEQTKGLRQWHKTVKAEHRDLYAAEMAGQLSDVGLSDQEGLGKAIAREMGRNRVKLKPGVVAEYADTEYGWSPKEPQPDVPEVVLQGDRMEMLAAGSSEMFIQRPQTEGQKAVGRIDSNAEDATRDDVIRSIDQKLKDSHDLFGGTE